MAKTREKWESLWNQTEGNEFDKSLKLMCEYSGYLVGVHGGGGLFGKIANLRWGSKYCGEVQKAISPFFDKNKTRPPHTVGELLRLVSAQLTEPQKVGGDLDIIIKLIREKTGAYWSKPEEKNAGSYAGGHSQEDKILTDEEYRQIRQRNKAFEFRQ